MKYFKSYTKLNCDLECLTNFTQLTCNCVQFGMPFDNNTEVCDYINQVCAQVSESTWLQQKLNHYLQSGIIESQHIFNSTNEFLTDCNCLPSCSSIQYKAEISQGSYQHNQFLKEMKLNYNDDQFSILFLFEYQSAIKNTLFQQIFIGCDNLFKGR